MAIIKTYSVPVRLILIGALCTAGAASSQEADLAEPPPMGLDFGTDDWIDDKELATARQLRDSFKMQAVEIGADDPPYWDLTQEPAEGPAGFRPWWEPAVEQPFNETSNPIYEDPESLILRAIEHSAQIRVFADVPVIRETAELEATGRFDVHLYLDGKFTDLDEPVGNTLKTGGPERFLEDEWLNRLGLRKRFITGTEIDLSQRWGVLNNNSEFLDPKDQANTRLALTVSQPLLNGFGVRYNRSLIDIARIDGSVALDEFTRQVESHLMNVTRAYWGLYEERSALLQRRALLERGASVVQEMEGRLGHDVGPAQISRARAKLESWRSDMTRSETAVRNAESKILSLVNDPELRLSERFELIPRRGPVTDGNGMSTEMAMALALEHRPEVAQAFKQIKAAAIRAYMTKRELLPTLNLVVQYYRDGLAGESDVSLAHRRQYDEGDGSWLVGLVFEYPFRNRKARARNTRRQAEVRQLNEQLRATLETIRLELEVSTREIKTAHREMGAKYSAMQATEIEVKTLEEREGVEVTSGGVHYLERLIGAVQRLTESEYAFLQSRTIYNIALVNMERATGTLLTAQDIQPMRYQDEYGLPVYRLEQLTDSR